MDKFLNDLERDKPVRFFNEKLWQKFLQLVEFNIHPFNSVLFGINFNPKVADFGLAKLLN
ncbi:hypothetical protein MTR_2g036450 [Medicago truncatula]|uniref:Uncharacterized protein n=1 Tax=Medicago truncatula TaxID=3880 RepID=G7IG59_MEDTR|nr:hypothetical protein MTR_2g036450 [Medicago truncatula]